MTGSQAGRLVILGLPYFGRHLEGLLDDRGWKATYMPHPGRNPVAWVRLVFLLVRADIVYLIGSRIDRRSPQDLFTHVRRRPLIIHWVGTDVQRAHREYLRRNLSGRMADRAIHLSDASWLSDELKSIGIRSEYVALPVPAVSNEAPPLPGDFRVLIYLPLKAANRKNFDMDTILRLPREFPDIQFTMVPSPPETLPSPLPSNLKALAWVDDMDALYRMATVHIRLTFHDGMSFMVLEALSRGRHVIWTFPIEGAIQAAGFEAVRDALADLYARHQAGTLELNTAGREYALSNFDLDTLTTALDARLRALL